MAPGIWQIAAFIVLGGTVVTYFLNNWALRHAESSQVTLYIYLQTVVATSLATAMGKPLPGTRFFLAALLVGAGLFWESNAAARRRRQSLASSSEPVE